MIEQSQLTAVGKFLKPHGVNGEVTALRLSDDLDFGSLSCVVVDIDGIFVPFFIRSVRPKGAETDLLGIDGITDETHASRLVNKTIYALSRDLPEEEPDGDGLFADELIGFEVENADSRELLGKVVDIDDSTANFLLIVETPSGARLLIPVAEEFIVDLDPQARHMSLSLPEGLLEMQQ